VTAAAVISAPLFKQALSVAGKRVRLAREELCALDASAGDGDLGVTLDLGFAEVGALLESTPDPDDIGALLRQVGMELARKAPSTIGTLLASGFLRAGKELAGCAELGSSGAVTLLSASAEGVAERGHAVAGERTVLDSMTAAAGAAAAKAEQGAAPGEVLGAGAAGAQKGAAATASMEPRHGRAGWIKDRAQGSRDAGAVAWAVFVAGLAEGCREPEPGQVDPA
jgi:phosphoenolpyruvate---glycerone phosphotransferase subunit DhaL